MAELTDKQQAFINEYLKCWNATKAAQAAGYAHPNVQGPRLLVNVGISKEIQQRIVEQKISADETLLSLAEIARGDMSDFFTVYGRVPVLDFEKAQKNGKLGLIKKLTMKDDSISFELYDKQSALNTFAKHHGLVDDKLKVEIDIKLVIEVVDAIKQLGQDPVEIFQEIINRAKSTYDLKPK